MAHEIILTSVRQGAAPDRHGFCAVAHDRLAPAGLIRTLEEVSGYHHVYPPDSPEAVQNPVAFSHTVFRQLGTVYHVVSRIGDAGIDYQLHSNHIAHHIVLEEHELPPEGPTWLMTRHGIFISEWVGPATIFERCRQVPTHTSSPYHLAPIVFSPDWFAEFQYQRGIETLTAAILHQRPVVFLYSPSIKLMPLLAETVRNLDETDRWKATFNTYYSTPSLETPPLCLIQCILKDSLEARLRIPRTHELVIDLTSSGAMFDPHERTADHAWQPSPGVATAAVSEIAPPLTTPEITLRPHGALQVVESIVRVRSPLLFYSVYGGATLLVLCLLLLLVGRLFNIGPLTARRPAGGAAGHSDPNIAPKPPVPPKPVDVLTPEEIAEAEQAHLQKKIVEARPLLHEARDKVQFPPVLSVPVPPDTGVVPPPTKFNVFAPLFSGGHVLDITLRPAFVPAGWEFITEKMPPTLPLQDDAPFVWNVIASERDKALGHEEPFMEITLSPEGLAVAWLPAALEPQKCHDAALLTIGEIQLWEVEGENDGEGDVLLTAIPLWRQLPAKPISLSEVFAEQNKSHRVESPLFFDTPPWKDIFADRDPSSQFVFTVKPLEVKTQTVDAKTTRFLFTTDVYDVHKVDPLVVAVSVTLNGSRVVVTDEAGLEFDAVVAKKVENAERIAAIQPEILKLRNENFLNPDHSKTEQIDKLQEESRKLTSRQLVCDHLIENLPEARRAVASAVATLKLQIEFSLAIKMDETRTLILQETK